MSGAQRQLRDAARELVMLAERCPDLFRHVLPISVADMETLIEIADFTADDDEQELSDAAE